MEKMTFWGYRRPDGRVGIRNKILILPDMQQTRTYMERLLYHLDVKTVRWILC